MNLFFKLEAAYLIIGLFILIVTLIVTTRSFMKKNLWKKALSFVSLILSIFIILHFYITKTRIIEVENSFNKGKKIICENKALRKISQSIVIVKSNNWTLKNHLLSSPNYERKFFTGRCLKY